MIVEETNELKSLVDEGNVIAQFRLARLFDKGGASTNGELSFKWYQAAARKGHALSQYILADKYTTDEKGFQWIETAVEQGFFWSLHHIWFYVIPRIRNKARY